MNTFQRNAVIAASILVIVIILAASRMFMVVAPGHVAVSTLFGKVSEETYDEGLHFPVNPLLNWTFYDSREKTIKEKIQVPTQDQLQTVVDVSVQYRVNSSKASSILRNIGTIDDVIRIHINPAVRSIVREQGKDIERAEHFFHADTQEQLKKGILQDLRTYLDGRGIIVSDVLIRDINLPQFIVEAIELKKEHEQRALQQKAELQRFKTEQEQKVAQAEAEKEAAEMESQRIDILSQARAQEISRINNAIQNNPAYIQLEAMQALKDISKDESSKIYFMNGDSPNPLPLMNVGGREK
ncbi:MAG: prohibitin family protein [Fibrobacterota bacterium]